jgi:ATP-binding cassette subfamily B (MDR/TAP) protein 1
MLVISIVCAFLISWKLTLVATGCLPMVWATTRLFSHISSKWEEKCDGWATNTGDIFTETLSKIRVVRALSLGSYFQRKHALSTTRTYKTGVSRAIYSGIAFGLGDAISYFIPATIFYYGTVIIISGSLPVSLGLEVVNLHLLGICNSTMMLSFVPQLSSSITTATEMLRLANLPLDSDENLGTRRLATPFPIRFSDLSFRYPSRNQKALSSITLAIAPAENRL